MAASWRPWFELESQIQALVERIGAGLAPLHLPLIFCFI